jgi:cation:H+ antiporter
MISTLIGGGDGGLLSALLFAAAAVVVWRAGTRLAGYADRFASATGLSGAVVGLVLLGGITSLPEIATSGTAAVTSGPALAVNNLLGGVSFQLLILAIADAVMGRDALTARLPRADVLAYGAMNVVLLVIAAGAAATGDLEIWSTGVGLGSVLIVLAYAGCVLAAREIDKSSPWRPVIDGAPTMPDEEEEGAGEPSGDSLLKVVLLLVATGVVILVAGYLLTRSGEALAERTGLGSAFFGATLLAGATSLPELSSAIAALRLNKPQLAIGDVFGGNLFDVGLILMVDLLDGAGPALSAAGPFEVIAALLGAVLAAVFIIGMVERRDRTILRMGWDSCAVVLIYLASLPLLWVLSKQAS